MAYKILIIEDDKVLNEMYAMKFEFEGFEVEAAYDGLQGIEKIKTFKPDIVLLDIMMPGMNGLQTVQMIKQEIDPKLKVIMFTNLNDATNMELAIRMGADDFLLKADTTPKMAVDTVRNMIRMMNEIY